MKEHLTRLHQVLGAEWYHLVLKQAWLSLATQPFTVEDGTVTTKLRHTSLPTPTSLAAEMAWDNLTVSVRQGQCLVAQAHPRVCVLVQEAVIEFLADLCVKYGLLNLLVLRYAAAQLITSSVEP